MRFWIGVGIPLDQNTKYFGIFSLCNADLVFPCQKIQQVTSRSEIFSLQNRSIWVSENPEFHVFRSGGTIQKKSTEKSYSQTTVFL
jgi:hypothetical protein